MIFKLLVALEVFLVVCSAAPWDAYPHKTDKWMHQHEGLLNQTKERGDEIKVVFLGDSITEGWEWFIKKAWTDHYANRGAFNYGISGDRTEYVLWRIANGELDGLNTKLVVLMIGTNNLGDTAANIAKGIQTIVDALRAKLPHSHIILLSLLPREPEKLDTAIHDINRLIVRFSDNKMIHYLDLAVHFELSLSHEIKELFTPDHVHLTAKGYEMWYKTMEPTFAHLIR